MGKDMKQECRLWSVWMTWVAIPGIAVLLGLIQGWTAGAIVLVVGVVAEMAYVRWFPRVSRWVGYGSVDDVPANASVGPGALPRVTLYTAIGCPFCPIIRQRLEELAHDLGFEMEEKDVTFRPRLLAAKGIRSVPVVETGGRYLVGNATSEKLLAFLKGSGA